MAPGTTGARYQALPPVGRHPQRVNWIGLRWQKIPESSLALSVSRSSADMGSSDRTRATKTALREISNSTIRKNPTTICH